jgi:hypothetical protein
MILVPSTETATRDALRDMAAATGQVFDVMTSARRHGGACTPNTSDGLTRPGTRPAR